MNCLRGSRFDRQPLRRVTRRAPCRVCGHPDWCSATEDGGLVICMRVSEGEHHVAQNGGHVHVLDAAHRSAAFVAEPVAPAPDIGARVEAGLARTTSAWHEKLATTLGLPAGSEAALRHLRCYREREHVAAFPMSARGRLCGVRYRAASGRKWSMRGGKEGLFVPTNLSIGLDTLVIVEGPTDAAAALALGIPVLGRPSSRGAVAEALRCVRALQPKRVTLLLDRDRPGIEGGVDLARALAPTCGEVRCALPPPPHKDVRAWIAAGATRDGVLSVCLAGRRVREVAHG